MTSSEKSRRHRALHRAGSNEYQREWANRMRRQKRLLEALRIIEAETGAGCPVEFKVGEVEGYAEGLENRS